MNSFDIAGRVDFSIKEAQWLADLHGIEHDLRDVVRLCGKCLELMSAVPSPEQTPQKYLDATWMAGEMSFASVVKYGRTFGSGVRRPIPLAWIEQLLPDDQKAHHYFKSLRDKFIAHSANAFEDNQVFAYLHPQFAPTEVKSIAVDTGRYVSLSSGRVERLRHLAGTLEVRVREEIASETRRVLQIARAMPLSDLLTRETDNRPIPGDADVSKGRRTP